MKDRIQKIRELVIEANEQGNWNSNKVPMCGCDNRTSNGFICRPITLADVLLAIHKKGVDEMETKTPKGFDAIESTILDTAMQWNLKKNSLTEQSEECINSIHDLLTNTHT